MTQFPSFVATNLRAAGVDLKTAQELLRHANSRITLDVYSFEFSYKVEERWYLRMTDFNGGPDQDRTDRPDLAAMGGRP